MYGPLTPKCQSIYKVDAKHNNKHCCGLSKIGWLSFRACWNKLKTLCLMQKIKLKVIDLGNYAKGIQGKYIWFFCMGVWVSSYATNHKKLGMVVCSWYTNFKVAISSS
jgi:hypothetical protein